MILRWHVPYCIPYKFGRTQLGLQFAIYYQTALTTKLHLLPNCTYYQTAPTAKVHLLPNCTNSQSAPASKLHWLPTASTTKLHLLPNCTYYQTAPTAKVHLLPNCTDYQTAPASTAPASKMHLLPNCTSSQSAPTTKLPSTTKLHQQPKCTHYQTAPATKVRMLPKFCHFWPLLLSSRWQWGCHTWCYCNPYGFGCMHIKIFMKVPQLVLNINVYALATTCHTCLHCSLLSIRRVHLNNEMNDIYI